MRVRVAVQGIDQLNIRQGKNAGSVMHVAFGMEASPASLGQIIKLPLENATQVRAGETVCVDVRQITESRGSLWMRGAISLESATPPAVPKR